MVQSGGAILALTSCGAISNSLFAAGMRAKGITRYLAYEVPVQRCRDRYPRYFLSAQEDLGHECALGVLDFDGRRIFLNFPPHQLGRPVIVDDHREAA